MGTPLTNLCHSVRSPRIRPAASGSTQQHLVVKVSSWYIFTNDWFERNQPRSPSDVTARSLQDFRMFHLTKKASLNCCTCRHSISGVSQGSARISFKTLACLTVLRTLFLGLLLKNILPLAHPYAAMSQTTNDAQIVAEFQNMLVIFIWFHTSLARTLDHSVTNTDIVYSMAGEWCQSRCFTHFPDTFQ